MARSIRGAVTEENLKSVGRERRSGGWGLEEGGEWIRSRGGSLEGGAAGREDRRLWQQVSPPWKAAIFRFVRAFRKTFAFLPREEERKASLFFSFPPLLPSIPPLFLSARLNRLFLLSFVFFSLLSSTLLLSLFLSLSLPPWLRVDEREEDSFLCFAGNRFLSYVKLQDGSSTFLPRGSLFLLLPKFIGGNVLFTL